MTKKSDIAQLIKKCKNYDRLAQKQLYMLYADELMSVAVRYTNDQAAAKDLLQDTFLKIFNRIDTYQESKGNFGAWINRILVNTAFNNYRKQNRMVFVSEKSFSQEVSTEFSVLQHLQAEDILQLLKKLPEGARAIFNLHIIEGYKHKEIGELLGISASASRSQLTRAKHLLRTLIYKHSEKDGRYPDLKIS